LIAYDGSGQALAAATYIGRALNPEGKHITLLHLLPQIPEALLDENLVEATDIEVGIMADWRREQRRFIDAGIERARMALREAGFADGQVAVEIRDKQVGVARDILQASAGGYSAVVIGRTGNSGLEGLSMGSVANKLLAATNRLPLVIVGGKPEPGKVLLAFDGSSGARNCVDFVGALLGDSQTSVNLCHVIRPLSIHQTGAEFFKPSYEKGWLEANQRRIVPALTAAKDALIAAGFHSNRISIEILSEAVSRAGALVREAAVRGIGTIVVGRRGLTIVNEFLIGRVSTKVVNLAVDRAVWVVN
jgi:nucleotide-binding universal stress UspA family protein